MQSNGQAGVSPIGAEDASDEANYRNVSALGVVSLALGIASPLALLTPLLTAIPLVGTAIAVVALRRIGRSEGTMIGRGAALAGLALCIACIGAVSSRALVDRHLRTRQAASLGVKWIQLLQAGQTEQAFNLTAASLPPVGSPDQHEATGPARAAQFAASPFVQSLLQIGPHASVRFERNLSFSYAGRYIIEQQYDVVSASGQPLSIRLMLTYGPVVVGGSRQWLVFSYKIGDSPASHTTG